MDPRVMRRRILNYTTGRAASAVAAKPWYKVIRNDAGPTRIDIYDDIGGAGGLFGPAGITAADFTAELATVGGDVEVHINSAGGDVFDGIAIFNSLAGRTGNVTTVVDGIAASIASIIAQAGRTRVVAPGSMMMIHDGLAACLGNAADMRDMADTLDQVSDNLAGIYTLRGGSKDAWRAAMRAETWYSAQDAVAAGLADKLAERPAAREQLAAHDLSMYAKVPDWLRAASGDGAGYSPAPYEREADETVQCPSCKKYNDTDARFCDQCGTKLTGRDDVKTAQAKLDKEIAKAIKKAEIYGAAVDTSAWDGPAAMSAVAASDDPAAGYKAICAGRKDGDPAKQSSWALPHHKHPGDAPNAAGVRNAMSRLPQTQGLTNEAAARAHLEAHMKAVSSGASDALELPDWNTPHESIINLEGWLA